MRELNKWEKARVAKGLNDNFATKYAPTKWSVLAERLDSAIDAVHVLHEQIKGLEKTKCGLTCDGCDTFLETEADFAKHFVIFDERFLNLGNCPTNLEKR